MLTIGWQGRFWGVWQRVPFDYTVEFGEYKPKPVGPAVADNGGVTRPIALASGASKRTAGKAVTGTAVIDGAHYVWTGLLTPGAFTIRFTGTRYEGHLELKRVADPKAER